MSSSPSMSVEQILRAVAVAVGIASGAALALGACSLGEGVTPDCDPSLPAGTDGACEQLGVCDDGRGGVLANEGCCIEASRQQLQICIQQELSGDWRGQCQPNAQLSNTLCSATTGEMDEKTPNVTVTTQTPACDMANDVFNYCLAGGLLFTGGGVGGGGTGGGGVGGGVGGGGTGGMAAGGAGGMGTGGAGGG